MGRTGKLAGKLEKVPIGKIKPYWRNPRKISEEAVKKVAESIKKFGYAQPIVVDKDYVIIVGHTRYKALKELGYKEVECLVVDLTPEEAREYRIVDNRTRDFTDWDWDALTVELRTLNFDEMQKYFDNLEDLINDSVGMNNVEIKDEDVHRTFADETEKYREKSEEIQNRYVEVICPQCGHVFYIDKKEVLEKL